MRKESVRMTLSIDSLLKLSEWARTDIPVYLNPVYLMYAPSTMRILINDTMGEEEEIMG